MKFWYKVWIVVDKVANKLTGGKEWETISSRMGKCLVDPKCDAKGKATSKFLCGLLDRIDKGHCIGSIEKEYMAHALVMMRSLKLKER